MSLIYTVFVFPLGIESYKPDFLKTKPALAVWFMLLGIVLGIGLYRYLKEKPSFSEWKSLEFLLPLLILIESLIQFFGLPLFHLFYIPFIVIISGRFPLKIIISCILAIIVLGAPALWWIDGYPTHESLLGASTGHIGFKSPRGFELLSGIYLSILITSIISYYIFYRKTKISKKAVKELQELKSSALNLEASTESSLLSEDRFSHLVKSILETQKELTALLNLTKKLTNADSATLFTLEGDSLILKASTDKSISEPTDAEKGYLSGIIKKKKVIIQPKLKGSIFDLRHPIARHKGSILFAPVLDGEIAVGSLVIDSAKEAAFDEREKDIAQEFALQAKQILKRTRTYVEVERFAKGFKALHESSITLSTSLREEKIAERFVEIVYGMLSSSAVGFFIIDKGKLRVIAKRGFEPEKEAFYTKGTYFDLIVRNNQPLHFSNLEKKRGVYPFKISETKTFFGIPIISEEEVLGVLAVASRERDAISSFQGYLLRTVADQAAMSITNAKLHEKVEKLAITDGLTGLFNHKHFQERLNEEFERIKRIPQPISLMLIDIDHFKKINDIYGHPAGDTVLTNIAMLLKRTLRGIDILARYGGEEFAAVLMGTESNGARKMAERLRSTVMNNPFFIDENKLTITISIGIATHPHDAETKVELIDKADQALYYAKKTGRNQVCEWKKIQKFQS